MPYSMSIRNVKYMRPASDNAIGRSYFRNNQSIFQACAWETVDISWCGAQWKPRVQSDLLLLDLEILQNVFC
jgi:hypothetical protein